MGKIITPTYRLELNTGEHIGAMTWERDYGRANDANLAKFVKRFEASRQPGGVNEHLGPRTVRTARIVRQNTGQIVATYTP